MWRYLYHRLRVRIAVERGFVRKKRGLPVLFPQLLPSACLTVCICRALLRT